MNEVDVKKLVDVGQRTALLLGEITGRLIMITQSPLHDDKVPVEDIHSLLFMMNDRLNSIYYEEKS